MVEAALQQYVTEPGVEQTPATVIGGLEFYGHLTNQHRQLFTPQACDFIRDLIRQFGPQLRALLQDRRERQQQIDRGRVPGFRPETLAIREAQWQIKAIPGDAVDRRVEITTSVDRKSLLQALNSNARVVTADFEDATSPTWDNIVQGHLNLHDAVEGTLSGFDSDMQRFERMQRYSALLMCQPRGLHAQEKHIRMNGVAVPASLVDFGCYFFHNVRSLLQRGSVPYFYLPKLESANEAAWWATVFYAAEQKFSLAPGTIKATVAIETLPAVFEMDEILYALRDHAVALCCGYRNYLFSYVKTLRNYPLAVLPEDRSLARDAGFLHDYSQLLVATCHRRGAMAIGDIAPYLPAETVQQTKTQLNRLLAEKAMESAVGYDASRIVHPQFVDALMASHSPYLAAAKTNQPPAVTRADNAVTAEALLTPSAGTVSEVSLRANLRGLLRYLEAWLHGEATMQSHGARQDLASAEFARSLIWQWLQYRQKLSNGKLVTTLFVKDCVEEELVNLRDELGNERFERGRFEDATGLLEELVFGESFKEFLTITADEIL